MWKIINFFDRITLMSERLNETNLKLMTRRTYENLILALEEAMGERADALRSIGESAIPGDWHDNFALDQAHRDSDLTQARLLMVQDMLTNYAIIDPIQTTDIVRVGNQVVIQYIGEADTETYTIGGSADKQYNSGFISNISPVGLALLGQSAGSVVEVAQEKKPGIKIKIVEIRPSNFE